MFRAECDERGVHTQREEIVEGGMVTGSLYRIAVLSLWASLCSNTVLPHPVTAGAQAQGRPGSAWCWAVAAHAAPRT